MPPMSVASPSPSTKSDGPPTAKSDDVDLAELLSTCIDACRRGCEVIRNVRHKSLHGTLDILDSVLYKIADDPRSALTEADGASQKVIVECLTNCWEGQIESGLIKIVGEEEDDHSTDIEGDESFDTAYDDNILSHFDNYNAPRPDLEPIHRNMFPAQQRKGSSENKDEIIIFIDPMDGTREFVEGRIHNVQCLIGITLNGVPVGGAMGIPMLHGDQIEIAYGLISSEMSEGTTSAPVSLLSGVKFFDALNPLDKEDGDIGESSTDEEEVGTLMVYSGDSKKPALKLAMDCLENKVLGGIEPGNVQEGSGSVEVSVHPPMRKIVAGGCGNKILSVQRHFQFLSDRRKEQCSIATPTPPPMVGSLSLAPPGSSSWDTAAPTAVLLASDPSARVTDLLGRPLVYDGENLSNKCGIVVSSGCVAARIHDRLCEGLCEDDALCDVLGVDLDAIIGIGPTDSG